MVELMPIRIGSSLRFGIGKSLKQTQHFDQIKPIFDLIYLFSFLCCRCRSVVVDSTGQPLVFDVDFTDPTGQIVPIGSPFPLGIVSYNQQLIAN